MTILDHLKDLLAHCAWADAMLFRTWEQAGGLEDPELRKRQTHVVATQEFFLKEFHGTDDLPWDKILSGEVLPPWHDRPLADFATLKAWSRSTHQELHRYVETLNDSNCQKLVSIPWFPGCEIPVCEALVQVAMHTQHHRGQIMTRLKQVTGKAVDVDYIIWVWKQRPEASWGI